MPAGERYFRLTVDDFRPSGYMRLRLADGQGNFLAAQEVPVEERDLIPWHGLFELDRYLRTHSVLAPEKELLPELGTFLAQKVLGPEVMSHLTTRRREEHPGLPDRRSGTLVVELAAERGPAVQELARLPWQLARTAGGDLSYYNLSVQVLPAGLIVAGEALADALQPGAPFDPGRPLRVLLIFSQARGDPALAMRREREELRELYLRRLGTRHRLHLDILQYGVTRDALRAIADRAGGYHLVHFSGHGHADLLVLETEDGRPDPLSGREFADLFTESGDLPHLIVLSACHSGEVALRPEMALLRRLLRELEEGAAPGRGKEAEAEPEGEAPVDDFSGAAHALLRAGVPQVVAMRYAVGDDFARDLCRGFYTALLAERQPPVRALRTARNELARRPQAAYPTLSRVTPVFYGGAAGGRRFDLPRGRSAQCDQLVITPQPVPELRRTDYFVGRTDALRRLSREFLGQGADHTCAVLYGLGGLGKSSLASELLHLRHADFELVLTASAKGHALGLEAWLREDLHSRLLTYLPGYADRCNRQPGTAVWAPRPEGLPIEAWRQQRLEALRTLLNTHRLLLAIDNFETNLATAPEEDRAGYACPDPHWAAALRCLADELEPGFSKLLVTSRRLPADLAAAERCLQLAVGPLPEGEALLFLRTAPHFRALLYPEDEGQWEANMDLLARVLGVSRGHPYLLARLHGLAADPEDLAQRLAEFGEAGGRYGDMGRIFAAAPTEAQQAEQERYFDDITGTATDALIRACSPEAQRLLRVITLAQEPMDLAQVARVGYVSEETTAEEDRAYVAPLLAELVDQGLLVEESAEFTALDGTTGERPVYRWHEIVRERAEALLPPATVGEDGEERDDGFPVRRHLRRYADMHLSVLGAIHPHRIRSRAEMETVIEAGRRAIRYLRELRDYPTLAWVINHIHLLSPAADFRRELSALIHELLEEVPAGEEREDLLLSLADVTRESDPRTALGFYHEALASAQAREDWHTCGIVAHQIGGTYHLIGDYPRARSAYEQALALVERMSGGTTPRLSTRADLARLLIMQGQLKEAAPEVAEMVQEAEEYYAASKESGWEPELGAVMAPADLLVTSLDVQRELELRRRNYAAVLAICSRQIEVQQGSSKGEVEIVKEIFNRAAALINMGQFDQAQRDLEYCLELDRREGPVSYQAQDLSELATVWDKHGDLARSVHFEEEALSLEYQIRDYSSVAISHNNAGHRCATLGRFPEALRHGAAAVLLGTVLGQGELFRWRSNLRSSRRAAAAQRASDAVPTVEELLAAFPGLRGFLAERGLTQAQAQAALDDAVARTDQMIAALEAQTVPDWERFVRTSLEMARAAVEAGEEPPVEWLAELGRNV